MDLWINGTVQPSAVLVNVSNIAKEERVAQIPQPEFTKEDRCGIDCKSDADCVGAGSSCPYCDGWICYVSPSKQEDTKLPDFVALHL